MMIANTAIGTPSSPMEKSEVTDGAVATLACDIQDVV
jgi:hypothetical protein